MPGFVTACAILWAASACGDRTSAQGDAGPFSGVGLCGGMCASACARVIAAKCQSDQLANTDLAACESKCLETQGKVPQACQCDYGQFLTCVAGATIQCPGRTCSGLVCIEQPLKVVGCESQAASVNACGGSCSNDPSVSVGGGSSGLSYSYTTSGCMCPTSLAPGAPPGSPCASFGDCAETCCSCSSSTNKFRSRVCLNGTCLGAPASCESVDAGWPSPVLPCP